MLSEITVSVPAAWLETLECVRKVFPEAVLAGGALRDLDNDREVKDIDIFVPHGDNTEHKLRAIFGDDAVHTELPELVALYMTAEPLRDVRSVYSCGTLPDGVTIQVITLQLDKAFSLQSVIERLDLGLCQIGTEGGPVVCTPYYILDTMDQTMTIMVDSIHRDRTLRRVERLQKKYPGWTTRG